MNLLDREGIKTCRQTVWLFRIYYQRTASTKPLQKPGRLTKFTEAVQNIIDARMEDDNKTTTKELSEFITRSSSRMLHLRSTILRGQRALGWTSRGTAYCRLIRLPKMIISKTLLGAMKLLSSVSPTIGFVVIKKGQKPCCKPRPKHSAKVHIRAGISCRGCTGVCVFDGIMNAEFYVKL